MRTVNKGCRERNREIERKRDREKHMMKKRSYYFKSSRQTFDFNIKYLVHKDLDTILMDILQNVHIRASVNVIFVIIVSEMLKIVFGTFWN